MITLGNGLWIAGFSAEVVLIFILTLRRTWRTLPAFFIFCAWEMLTTAGAYAVLHRFPVNYRTFYLVETVGESILEIAVLVELAWSVLRPIRRWLPRTTPVGIGVLVLLLGVVIWPFSAIHSLTGLAPLIHTIVHVQQTTAVLRVVFFITLVGCSQLLSIGWRDRELQVVTGLGIYSLVSLVTAVIHTHQADIGQYSNLNQLVLASYLCSLLYWVYSFAQKEAERREFTPQMQNALLAMAGVAREQRLALAQAAMERRKSKF